MTDRSPQELIVLELSAHLFGAQSIFKPTLYRNGEEPADLVWIIGRCVVIVNMTSGNKSLVAKRRHNNAQMHRWIRRWKQGEILRGPDINLGYAEVDFIVGLSVVGGNHAASVIEEEQIFFSREKGHTKLCGCATISENTFRRLAKRSVGVRDILEFLEYLRERGDIVGDEDAVGWIESRESNLASDARCAFQEILPDPISLNQAWSQTRALFAALKNSNDREFSTNIIFSDLSFADAVWIGVADISLALRIAKPGESGVLIAGATRAINETNINVIAVANTGVGAKSANKLAELKGLTIISILEPDAPLKMIATSVECYERGFYKLLADFNGKLEMARSS